MDWEKNAEISMGEMLDEFKESDAFVKLRDVLSSDTPYLSETPQIIKCCHKGCTSVIRMKAGPPFIHKALCAKHTREMRDRLFGGHAPE